MEENYERFWTWVERTLREQNLSVREVERQAGLSNAVLGSRLRKRTKPSEAVYAALSKVLSVSRRELLALAGQIEPVDELIGDDEYIQLHETLKRMTPGEIQNVLRYIRFQYPEIYRAAMRNSEPEA